MRIMEICSGGWSNGAIIHCQQLTRELARRGHAVTLVCRPGARIAKELRDDPVTVVESDLHRWPADELKRIAAIAREQEIDVIHTHQSRAHFFGVLLRWFYRVPCVATAHNRKIQLHWMFNDHVLANSEATRRFHRWLNLVSPRRIETVYYFIDTKKFAAVPDARRAELRREFGLSETTPVFGILGEVIPRKGHVHLVRALPRIVAAVPGARCMVVGKGKEEHTGQLRAEAERLGVAEKVIWAGFRSDIPNVMRCLDVCVSASLEEAFGLTAPEAMAAGLPVVATNVGGLVESVREGETGCLVPPANPQALADAITPLLLDPKLRAKYGEAGRRRAAKMFAVETHMRRVEDVFSKLAQQRRAA